MIQRGAKGEVFKESSWGVSVSTTWQGLFALSNLSLLITKTIPNLLWIRPEALRKMGDGRSDIEGGSARGVRREGAEQVAGYGLPATGEGRAGGQGSVVSGHPSSISKNPSTDSVRHERPKRFIYGKKNKRTS